MTNYSPSENRRRWEDGTMSEAEWTKVIEDHLAKDKEKRYCKSGTSRMGYYL